MSQGLRWTLAAGVKIANQILITLPGMGLEVMGSVRRKCPDIGDLDLIAPMPRFEENARYEDDRLFQELNKHVHVGWQRPEFGLFGTCDLEALRGPATKTRPWFDAGDGYRPGFKMVKLTYHVDRERSIPVQIHRYTRDNKGWITVMRTGPAEFNPWLLNVWKRMHRIAPDQEASHKGHLVDGEGLVVPVREEADVFRLAGVQYYTPEERSKWARSKTS